MDYNQEMIDAIEWLNGYWSAINHMAYMIEYFPEGLIIPLSQLIAAMGSLFAAIYAAKSSKTSKEISYINKEDFHMRLKEMQLRNTTSTLEQKSILLGDYNDLFMRCMRKRLDLIIYINKAEIEGSKKKYGAMMNRRNNSLESLRKAAEEYKEIGYKSIIGEEISEIDHPVEVPNFNIKLRNLMLSENKMDLEVIYEKHVVSTIEEELFSD